MGRRKQIRPQAFKPPVGLDTPSDIDAAVLDCSRPNSGSESLPEKKGLVASIWEAACQDQAYYEQQQQQKGQVKRKRGGGGRKAQTHKDTLEAKQPAAWFAVCTRTSSDVCVFAVVDATNQCGNVEVGGSSKKMKTARWKRRPNSADNSVWCTVMDGAVLLRSADAGTRALNIGEDDMEDVSVLLRAHVVAVVRDGLEDNRVGLGVTEAGFASNIAEGVRQRLKRVILKLGSIVSKAGDIPQHLPQIVSIDEDHDTELDASRLYELIKPTGEEPAYEDPEGRLSVLLPKLHGYQKRVLRWMVDREMAGHFFDDEVGLWEKVRNGASGSCFYVHSVSGELVAEAEYVDRVALRAPNGGIACDEMGLGKTVEVLALIAANPLVPEDVRIQDHRGKMKTTNAKMIYQESEGVRSTLVSGNRRLEMACVCGAEGRLKDNAELSSVLLLIQCINCGIFQHMHCVGVTSFTKPDDWKCMGCCSAEVLEMGLIESKATLVVCPTPILSQWQSEIDKHVLPGTLKVVTYLGQDITSGPRSNYRSIVTPHELASADVVLTTYDTLRKDLHRNPDKQAVRSLRYTKRYHAVPTPLTSIKFWRIVVDEAQMVESSTAKATEMVRKIAAVNHWAVTGTPISRGLEDLFGLFAFLGMGHVGWHSLIQNPLESGTYDEAYKRALSRLIKLLKPGLGGIMWRSSKKDVVHELRLPDQTVCHNKLRFSNIEKHFYDRQHQSCCSEADKALFKSLGDKSNDITNTRPLTKREERKLLLPLLRLRQACVHPQVGAGGLKSLSHVKTPMSMVEVLTVMVGKAKIEAEDAQRLLLSTINGLAGLEILRGRFAEAASRYRSVLKISKDNSDLIRMDKLQTLHTVYNLTQILDKPGVGKTLDDDSLASSIEPLERKYLSESLMRLEIAESELVEIQQQHDELVRRFVQDTRANKDIIDGWWVSAVALIVAQHDKGKDVAAEELVSKLKKDLNEDEKYRRGASANAANIADRFTDLAGLQEMVSIQLSGMEESRTSVMSVLKHLGDRVARKEAALVDTAAHCGTCRSFNATSGIICEHCHFNKDMMAWEMRLFSLIATKYVTSYGGKKTKVKSGSGAVDRDAYHQDGSEDDNDGPDVSGLALLEAEDVADHAHRRAMHRVGVGGLGESSLDLSGGFGTNWEGDKRRSGRTGANKVSTSNVVRRPSQTEHVLRIILSTLKRAEFGGVSKFGNKSLFDQEKAILTKAAECHLGILELRRKEYLKVGSVAMSQRQILYALDELNMSRMRIKLRSQGQVLSADEERYMVHPVEIPAKIEEFESELIVSQAELSKTLGTLKYLKFLERMNQPDNAATKAADSIAADPCPVCHDDIADDLAMLPCGHILCVSCNLKILEKENRNSNKSSRDRKMKCPTCRAVTPASETAVVVNEGINGDCAHVEDQVINGDVERDTDLWQGEETLTVAGGYGGKLEAVIRRVKKIMEKIPDDKIIIFSTWQDALDILAHALCQNHIPCLYPKTRQSFDQSISQFRMSDALTESTPRVLLLLLKQGGNGLNLQQAQHVMFLEPVMDPGEEAQAIGRVNRMGQTRQTFVHRFTFRDSIEENVNRINAEKKLHENRKSKHQRKAVLSVGDVAQLLR